MAIVKKSYKIVAENPQLIEALETYLRHYAARPIKPLMFGKEDYERRKAVYDEECSNMRIVVKNIIKNVYPEFCDGKHNFGSCKYYGRNNLYVFEIIREMEIIVE